MPIFLRKYGLLLLPAALGGAVALAGVALYLKAMIDSSFMAGSETYEPKIARPLPQKGSDWNLGR